MECCGEPRRSRYCPECGKRLAPTDPLAELLDRCRAAEEQSRGLAERNLKRAELHRETDGTPGRYPKLARTYAEDADRWKAWGDALARLIDSMPPAY